MDSSATRTTLVGNRTPPEPSPAFSILLMNQWHRLPGHSGIPRTNELTSHWVREGARVRVIASNLDHQTGRPPRARAGAIGYEDSIEVRRVRTWAVDKRSSSRRILRDATFMVGAALAGSRWRQGTDVVVASSPPLFTCISGVVAARLARCPLVLDIRDLWPDYAVDLGVLRGQPARAAFALEAYLYRAANHIVVVTHHFRDRLIEKGVPEEKISVIPNGADLEFWRSSGSAPATRRRLGWGGRFVFLFAGTHGPSQGLHVVLDAASMVGSNPAILFAFVGNGSEKPALMAEAKRRGLTNIRFYDGVPREEMPELIAAADVGLVSLLELPSFRGVYPGKLFEIMAAGKPVLALAEGATAELVSIAKAGIAVAPSDFNRMRDAVLRFVHDRTAARIMGENGRSWVQVHHNRRALAGAYLRLLEEVAS